MKTIQMQCPAKINLLLKIKNKRPDGFHDIESIMQTINLYDYLTISVKTQDSNEIVLNGNSNEIPYNEHNLVYKAAELFYNATGITNTKTLIHIEKNIPVSAGLAGGSTDAAGTLYGLNEIFGCPLTINDLDNLCAKLGSDLNVCLHGGRILAKGRGEIITPQEFEKFDLSIIKPINLGISAKEAYTKFSQKIEQNIDIELRKGFENDLEWAILNDYKELLYIKKNYPNAVMTGSGSAYFVINSKFNNCDNYYIKNNLSAIDHGIRII